MSKNEQINIMFISKKNNQDYFLAKECVEKYIIKPDIKLVIKKIKSRWNKLQGNFKLAEELFTTAKIKEENIHFSKFIQIRDYLKFKINLLETRIKQYLYLIQVISIFLVIDILANFLITNSQIIGISKGFGISLIILAIYSIIKIFSDYYLLFQYRLMQPYFDQEKTDKWLKKYEIAT